MKRPRMEPGSTPPESLWKRLGWMALIWAASVAALGLVALAMRWLMALAGLTL